MVLPKHPSSSSSKQRKILTLETKLVILKRTEKGEKASLLSKAHQVNKSSIRAIRKNTDNIRAAVRQPSACGTKCTREIMESMLAVWIDQNKKLIS